MVNQSRRKLLCFLNCSLEKYERLETLLGEIEISESISRKFNCTIHEISNNTMEYIVQCQYLECLINYFFQIFF